MSHPSPAFFFDFNLIIIGLTRHTGKVLLMRSLLRGKLRGPASGHSMNVTMS